MNDIFEPVIRRLTQEIAHKLPDIPADLKKAHVRTPVSGGGGAARSGGGGLGIAAGPLGAIAGRVPKAVGTLIGFLTGGRYGSHGEEKHD